MHVIDMFSDFGMGEQCNSRIVFYDSFLLNHHLGVVLSTLTMVSFEMKSTRILSKRGLPRIFEKLSFVLIAKDFGQKGTRCIHRE